MLIIDILIHVKIEIIIILLLSNVESDFEKILKTVSNVSPFCTFFTHKSQKQGHVFCVHYYPKSRLFSENSKIPYKIQWLLPIFNTTDCFMCNYIDVNTYALPSLCVHNRVLLHYSIVCTKPFDLCIPLI